MTLAEQNFSNQTMFFPVQVFSGLNAARLDELP
jgi:hypothetical protein